MVRSVVRGGRDRSENAVGIGKYRHSSRIREFHEVEIDISLSYPKMQSIIRRLL